MKKTIVFLLILVLLIPLSGFAASPKGVKVEIFHQRMIDSTKEFFKRIKAPFVEMDSQSTFDAERTDLTGSVMTVNMLACSFEGSDIVEYAAMYCPLGTADNTSNAYGLGFLAGVVDNKKADKRLQSVVGMMTSFISSASYDVELGAVCSARSGNYNAYMLSYGDNGLIWAHLNEASTLSIKDIYAVAMERLVDQSRVRQSADEGTVSLIVGTYICPDHIPAGEYKVTPQKGGNLFVKRGTELIVNEVLYPDDGDEIGRLILQEGDEIEIAGGAKFVFNPLK